jgi:hypothetical protein
MVSVSTSYVLVWADDFETQDPPYKVSVRAVFKIRTARIPSEFIYDTLNSSVWSCNILKFTQESSAYLKNLFHTCIILKHVPEIGNCGTENNMIVNREGQIL